MEGNDSSGTEAAQIRRVDLPNLRYDVEDHRSRAESRRARCHGTGEAVLVVLVRKNVSSFLTTRRQIGHANC